jgi:hypothetical protein
MLLQMLLEQIHLLEKSVAKSEGRRVTSVDNGLELKGEGLDSGLLNECRLKRMDSMELVI